MSRFIRLSKRIAVCFLSVFATLTVTYAYAAADCSALNQPVYHAVNPTRESNLLTPWENEIESAAAQHGFSDIRGILFYASLTPEEGLIPIYRLYHPGRNGFLWTNEREAQSAVAQHGYQSQGIKFYVSPYPSSCTQAIHRYYKNGMHRYVTKQQDMDALVAAGWQFEGKVFYAVLPVEEADTVFSFAVIPDTQQEAQVIWQGNPRPLNDMRLSDRTQWLVNNKNNLNLKFVLHSGDVTSWGERDPHQYDVASNAMQRLEAAGIPYVLSVGNHDTRAVCAGGSACTNEKTWITVRELPLFNNYFHQRFGNMAGQYELGNLSNVYSLFEAGGLKWMVLWLELWPRTDVINWAGRIVAEHPEHNVILVTHAYLKGDVNGYISTSNGGYGANSPQFLFDNLVKKYRNIRFVFSGHEGTPAASRVDTGSNGNKIASFMQAFHATGAYNPVRIVTINTENESITTYIYSPNTDQDWDSRTWKRYDYEVNNMNYVR